MAKLGLSYESAKQISAFLVSIGLISEEQHSGAVSSSEEGGKGLVDTLIEFGFINEDQILNELSEAYEIEMIDLMDTGLVSASAVKALPIKFISENRVIPIYDKKEEIGIAICEPSALSVMTSIKLLTNKRVKTYLATISQVDRFLLGLTDLKPSEIKEKRASVTEVDKSQARSSVVIDFVDKALKDAIKLGVSDIHLEVFKKSARMRYRLDGVLASQKKVNKELYDRYAAIITRIKIMSKLDIAERRLPQDGAISIQYSDREVDLRVSILPTSFGERVVMRILDVGSISLTLETLGFLEKDEQAFKSAVDAPQGMVLVTGPTGSGKSTTLYAALGRINHEDINILTAEDPVEFTIDGVGQVHVKEDIGLTFSAVLRSFLRQDPEVIMVGEIRDKETVDIAIKAALTGHLVLSTLHTNDAVSTITRLINMGVAPYLVTSSLKLVVAQRLARKICEDCKVEDESVTHAQLKSIGFTEESLDKIKLYKGKGCPKCNKTGYKGRQGIYEVLTVSDNIKEGILADATASELLKIAKVKDGFSTMQMVGRNMMKEGYISIEEYQRILMGE
jgi:type IV pilus assembly protein PilB